MRKLLVLMLFLTLPLLLAACGSTPNAKITSTTYEETFNRGGVSYNFQGQDIIKIVLDFKFDKSIASGLDPASEDYRDAIFTILVEGAHLYYKNQEVERFYGYWPQEAGNNYAKEMTLFYLVPSGHSVSDLRFVYNGSILGEGASGLDTNIKPQ